MRRIVLVIESLGSGGAERQLVGLATLLKQGGDKVAVIAIHNKDFYLDVLRKENIDFELCEAALNKYVRPYKLSNVINRYEPDVVISFLPGENIALCIGRLVGFLKCKKIVISERSHTMKIGLREYLFYALYSLSDCLVANSISECENIKSKFKWLKNKTFAIPNFVDTKEFYCKKFINKDIDVFNLICVGRIRECKNIIRFMHAIRILIDRNPKLKIHIKWFGNNYGDEYSNRVKYEYYKLKLFDVFEFCDPIKDIHKEYLKADAFCLPSLYEGYPNVLVEAMSTGLPILCSNICENPNIVENGINGFLFDPYNIDNMTDALEKMVNLEEEQRFKMGEINRKKVEIQNSKECFVKSYIKLIENL